MSITVSEYSSINAKAINLQSDIIFHGATDDTKKVRLRLNGDPSAAGTQNYNLPVITSDATLLSTASDINVDQLNVSGATDIADQTADTDQFLVYDASASAMKKVSGTNLKSYVGASGLSAGDINNSNLFAANVVDASALADNSVDAGAIQAGVIVDAKISGSANIAYNKLNLANSVANGNLAGSIADGKLSSGPTAAKSCEATGI